MNNINTAFSVVEPSPTTKRVSLIAVSLYAIISLIPIVWIVLTSFKSPQDSISYPPKYIPVFGEVQAEDTNSAKYQVTLEGYVNLFTNRSRQSPEYLASLPPAQTWYDEMVRERQMVITGPSKFGERYSNSLIIGFGSTFLAIFLGTLSAYAFSRFKIPLKDDILFFILSTRMMPPIAVSIPIFLMYRSMGLSDSYAGMIILYTAVNMGLAVWLLHSFIDEIPREYEEAAMIDGYSRLQAFIKVVLPQATTGIASTAMLCLVFAWNEYAFALLLTSGNAQTAPPFIPTIIGEGGLDWPAVAAGTTLFLIPVMVFTILVRKHLLRGITFGALRK